MIVPMKQVSIVGRKTELKNIIDALKDTVSFEMAFQKQFRSELSEQDSETFDKLKTRLARVGAALAFAQKLQTDSGVFDQKVWDSIAELKYTELRSVKKNEKTVLAFVSNLEKVGDRLKQIKSDIAKNNEIIQEMKPYENLPIRFGDIEKTKNTFVICGILPEASLRRFKLKTKLDNIVLTEYPSAPGKVVVVLAGLREQQSVANTIKSYRFEQCKLSLDQTAADRIAELESHNTELDAEHAALIAETQITGDDVQGMKGYHDYLLNEINTFELMGRTARTERCCVATGWIMAKDEEYINGVITKSNPDVIIRFADPGPNDKPPAVMVNSKIITPFQGVTTLYGAPGPGDMDPNPFVAFFFFVFFGFMIGDVGYGLLLIAGTAFAIWKMKPQTGMKNMLALFGICGFSALIWGSLYSSFFGFRMGYAPIFDPMEKATEFLILSICLGLIQIMAGIALNGYNAWRKGKWLDALLDSGIRLVLFLGLIMFVAGMFIESLAMMGTIGMYVTLVAIAGLILTGGRKSKKFFGKIIGGLAGVYGLVNYFGDLVSYARLFALALVGAVVAMAGNEMGKMMFDLIPIAGYPIGIIVAGAFHMFNLALALLGAYVHGARLQFVEFFSKFFKGEGKVFQPTVARLKYTRLKVDSR